jgi:hypothetical protein
LVLPAAFVLVSACSRKPPEPGPEPSEPKTTTATSAAPAENRPSTPAPSAREITWTDPPGWQKVAPSSPMRKASYRVPAAPKDPEDGEVAVFYFKGEGGGTDANIQRWITQFSDAKPADIKRTERTMNGMKQTIVEVQGTFASGMPGGAPGSATPKSNYRLIGAVVETTAGPYFFKMTGPNKTVDAARGAFYTLLDSIKSS